MGFDVGIDYLIALRWQAISFAGKSACRWSKFPQPQTFLLTFKAEQRVANDMKNFPAKQPVNEDV